MNTKAVDMSQPSNIIKHQMHNNYLANQLNYEQLQNIVKNLTEENDYLHKRLSHFKWRAEENESAIGYLEDEVAILKDYVYYYEYHYYYNDNPDYNSSSNRNNQNNH